MIPNRYLTSCVVESPVALVLVEAGSRRDAAAVSYFSELAHHPTTLWVSIARDSLTYELLESSQKFALAVLARDQREIALLCGQSSGRDTDKCAALNLYRHESAFWFLRGALACSACRVRQTIDVGDHRVYMADILSGVVDSRRAHMRQLLQGDL
jgi:flavin reductase (DIM6/NTAB) family NADH-FMN oxidoreductase RutF